MNSINVRRTSHPCAARLLAVVFAGIALSPAVLRTDALGASTVATCTAAKVRAAGKLVFDQAKCHQRALLVATAVDPGCLAKAETRFLAAVTRAELAGPCPGTMVAFDAITAECVESIATCGATTTPTTTTTSTTAIPQGGLCCQGSILCTQTDSPDGCAAFGAAPGALGTMCDGTGACATPPVAGGPCCQVDGRFCLAGPSLNQSNCASLNGTFSASATCTASGCVQ